MAHIMINIATQAKTGDLSVNPDDIPDFSESMRKGRMNGSVKTESTLTNTESSSDIKYERMTRANIAAPQTHNEQYNRFDKSDKTVSIKNYQSSE